MSKPPRFSDPFKVQPPVGFRMDVFPSKPVRHTREKSATLSATSQSTLRPPPAQSLENKNPTAEQEDKDWDAVSLVSLTSMLKMNSRNQEDFASPFSIQPFPPPAETFSRSDSFVSLVSRRNSSLEDPRFLGAVFRNRAFSLRTGTNGSLPNRRSSNGSSTASPSSAAPRSTFENRIHVRRPHKISSSSDPSRFPKTIKAYQHLYANGTLELDDPPLPPMYQPHSCESGFVPPHHPRTLAISRLLENLSLCTMEQDPHLCSTTQRVSIKNHPLLDAIVAQASAVFCVKAVVVSLICNSQQTVVASLGSMNMDTGRSSSFCSHTVLNGQDGMVILNTDQDWRFKNSVHVSKLGIKFYAGMPLFSSSAKDPLPIGTICIVDDAPRESFTLQERSQLRSFALEVSKIMDKFVEERRIALDALINPSLASSPESGCSLLHHSGEETDSVTSLEEFAFSDDDNKKSMSEHTYSTTTSFSEHVSHIKVIDHDSGASTCLIDPFVIPSDFKSDDYMDITTPNPSYGPPLFLTFQSLLDTALSSLARKCSLSLVYLVVVDYRTTLTVSELSSFNPFGTPTFFGPDQHLQVLESPEKALHFKSAVPQSESIPGVEGFTRGLLLTVAESEKQGIILGGYTRDRYRELNEIDLNAFISTAEELGTYFE